MDLYWALAGQRRAIADRLDTLTPEQWQVRTLCTAWDVHNMVAHLVVSSEINLGEGLRGIIRARAHPDRLQQILVDNRMTQSPTELVARLRANAESRSAPPIVGIVGPYTDALVHAIDMWIPLGFPADQPAEVWRPSLDFLVSRRALVGFLPTRAPSLSYQATDLDWQHGSGLAVTGRADAIGLAILGRTARLGELSGPGAATLRAFAQR